MAQENINLGTSPSGSDGDTTRTALQKTQDNFTDLYGQMAANATAASNAQTAANAAQSAIVNANLLINGAGQINQRGYVSGTATTAANQYTMDRWKVLTSGQNLSWTTANGVATFTAPAGGVSQVVEGAAVIGGNYVLSWAGTATATVAGNAVTSGTPFTLTANTNAAVVFSGGTFTQPKLERGATATPFDFRQPQQEKALCQRYFQTIDTVASGATQIASGFAYTATQANFAYTLPMPMRAAPTITPLGQMRIVFPGLTNQCSAGPSIASSTNVVLTMVPGSSGNFTAGTPGLLRLDNPSTINFDAEL